MRRIKEKERKSACEEQSGVSHGEEHFQVEPQWKRFAGQNNQKNSY